MTTRSFETTSPSSEPRPFTGMRGAAAALGILCLLAVAPASHAVDDDLKVYQATGCKAAYASHADRLVYSSRGALRNISTLSAYVVCPVIADEFDWLGIRSEGWDTLFVYGEDNNATQDISCTFSEVDVFGALTATFVGRARQPGGRAVIGLASSTAGASRPHTRGYALRCVIPPRTHQGSSALLSYSFTEE